MTDFDRYVAEHNIPEEDYPRGVRALDRRDHGRAGARFEKVEREEPADGVVIEGDDL